MKRRERRPKRYWNQTTVVEAIRQWRKKGNSLRHNDVRRGNPTLLGAAYRFFENWGAAVRAAGFPYEGRSRRKR